MSNYFNFKLWWSSIDKINFILISVLLIIGIILSISLNDSIIIFNKHLVFAITSFFIMVILSFFEPKSIRRISVFSICIFVIILLIVLLLDSQTNGSNRWLKIFGFSLQPSEFIKPFYFVLSAWLITQGINGRKSYIVNFEHIFSYLLKIKPKFDTSIHHQSYSNVLK